MSEAKTLPVINEVKRSQFASFLQTDEKLTRMNLGITTQTLNYGAKTEKQTFIGEDNARQSVFGYEMELPTQQTAISTDPIFKYIDAIRRKRGTGAQCKSQLVLAYLYDGNGKGQYPAEKSDCTIVVNSFGGDGGGKVVIDYTVSVDGDGEHGYITIAENGDVTFTKGEIPG